MTTQLAVKVLIAGGFGAGKTTLVNTVSEIQALRTEEALTSHSVGVDDTSGVEQKTTTTVAMDFGRISLDDGLVLYVFGTPGQKRFWFMWDELALGSIGAVVVADARRLGDCFSSTDFFERRGMPFIVALNRFNGAPEPDIEAIRTALDLDPHVPVVSCDARQNDSVKQVLITLVEHILGVKQRQRTPAY
jgi:signal recognition particle receptor subunit beta